MDPPSAAPAPTAYYTPGGPAANKGFENEAPGARDHRKPSNQYQHNYPSAPPPSHLAFNFGNSPHPNQQQVEPPPNYDERPPLPSPRPSVNDTYASTIGYPPPVGDHQPEYITLQ